MLTAGRDLRLAGRSFRAGEAIPTEWWMSEAIPERNRQAMVRNRWVKSPDLTPDKATLRARKQGLTTDTPAPMRAPDVDGVRMTEAFPCTVADCGRSFLTKSALGGHMRGHAKRGEV